MSGFRYELYSSVTMRAQFHSQPGKEKIQVAGMLTCQEQNLI